MLFDLITEQNAKYYRKLVPEIYGNRMFMPGAVCVGAAMELEDSDKFEPAGVMILNVADKNCLQVDYLQVNPDYREQEVGTLLLEYAFALAKRMDIPKLEVRMPEIEDSEADGLDDARAYFFLRRGFVWTERSEREWWFSIDAIEDYKEASLGKEDKKMISIGKLVPEKYKEVFDMLTEGVIQCAIPILERAVAKDLSFAYLEDGVVKGFLLTERFEETYYPFVFVKDASETQVMNSLFRRFLVSASQNADRNCYVRVMLPNEAWRDVVRKILAQIQPIDIRILEADNDSMECTAAAIEHLMELEEEVEKEEEEFPTAFKVVEYEYYGGEVDRLEENTVS